MAGRRRSILKSRTSLGAADMSVCASILDDNQGLSEELPLSLPVTEEADGGTTSPTSRRRRVSFAQDTRVREIRNDSTEGASVYMDMTQVIDPNGDHSSIDQFNTTTLFDDHHSMRHTMNDSGDTTSMSMLMDLTQVSTQGEHAPLPHFNLTNLYEPLSMSVSQVANDFPDMSMYMDLDLTQVTRGDESPDRRSMNMDLTQVSRGDVSPDRRSVCMDLTQVSKEDESPDRRSMYMNLSQVTNGDESPDRRSMTQVHKGEEKSPPLSEKFKKYDATRLGEHSMQMSFDEEEVENCPPAPTSQPAAIRVVSNELDQARMESFPRFLNLNIGNYGAAPSAYLLRKPPGFGSTTSRFGQFGSVKTPYRQKTFIPRPRMTSVYAQTSTPPTPTPTILGGRREPDPVKEEPKPLVQTQSLLPKVDKIDIPKVDKVETIPVAFDGGRSELYESSFEENLLRITKMDEDRTSMIIVSAASEPTENIQLPVKEPEAHSAFSQPLEFFKPSFEETILDTTEMDTMASTMSVTIIGASGPELPSSGNISLSLTQNHQDENGGRGSVPFFDGKPTSEVQFPQTALSGKSESDEHEPSFEVVAHTIKMDDRTSMTIVCGASGPEVPLPPKGRDEDRRNSTTLFDGMQEAGAEDQIAQSALSLSARSEVNEPSFAETLKDTTKVDDKTFVAISGPSKPELAVTRNIPLPEEGQDEACGFSVPISAGMPEREAQVPPSGQGTERFEGLHGLAKVRAMERLDLELEPLSPDELEEWVHINGFGMHPKWVAITLEMCRSSRLMTTDEEDMKKLLIN